MGKNDWQNLESNADLSEVALTRNRGRGWRILSGVLFVASATFAAAYYLPLYRAHASLSREYRTLSTEASTQHKQLADTLDTLKQISAERDQLNKIAASKKSPEALLHDAEKLERDVQTALKKYLGKGKVQISRDKERLSVSLSAPAMVHSTTGDLTDSGKKVLCQLAGELKSANARVAVKGYSAPVAGNPTAVWKLAAVRAAVATQLVSEICGVDPRRIEAVVHEPAQTADDGVLTVEITPQ